MTPPARDGRTVQREADAQEHQPVHRPLRFLTDYFEDALEYGTALECPSCGGRFTHSATVEVYQRAESEQRDGLKVHKDGSTSTVECAANPSTWRQGLRVYFECETCDHPFSVVIAQHKGQTLFRYEVAPDSPAAARREPITVRGAPPDWRDRVERLDDDILLAPTQGPRREADVNQIAGLMRHAERRGLTARDLIALGIELGRLHPSRADGPDLQGLTMTEAGKLFDIVRAWEPHQ